MLLYLLCLFLKRKGGRVACGDSEWEGEGEEGEGGGEREIEGERKNNGFLGD